MIFITVLTYNCPAKVFVYLDGALPALLTCDALLDGCSPAFLAGPSAAQCTRDLVPHLNGYRSALLPRSCDRDLYPNLNGYKFALPLGSLVVQFPHLNGYRFALLLGSQYASGLFPHLTGYRFAPQVHIFTFDSLFLI